MQQISLRKIFVAVMGISSLLLFVLLYMNATYSDNIVYYNSFVSFSINTTSDLDEIEKNYYRYFVSDGMMVDERQLIDEAMVSIENAIDKVEDNQIYESKLDINNFENFKLRFEDLKRLFENETAYQSGALSTVINTIDSLKTTATSIKQDAVVIVRENNLRSGIINKMMVGYDIIILIVIFIIVDVQLLRPITKFRKVIEARLESNEISPPKIEMGKRHELGIFIEKINVFTERLTVINELNARIYSQDNFDDVVDYVFHSCKPFFPYQRFGIAIISEDGEWIKALRAKADYPIILDGNYRERLNETSLASVIRSREIRIINDLEAYLEHKPTSDSTKMIVSEGMKSSMTVPLILENQVVGVIFFSANMKNAYNEAHKKFVNNLTNSLAIAFEKSFVFDDLILATVKGFANIVESKDHVTGNHIDRMSYYSKFIAECLYKDDLFINTVDEAYIEKIFKFSPLHDIGKVGISESILNKPGKLTTEEFTNMKEHTLIGHNVIVDMTSGMFVNKRDYFKVASEIAKGHHEKFDGSGYPEGLSGDQIPLCARIVAVADVFDALTNVRPYKDAYSFEKATEMVFSASGTHFDPVIIGSLKNHFRAFKALYEKLQKL